MTEISMTDAIAHSIGWDAGNRSMRRHGRTAWCEEDWNAAAEATHKALAAITVDHTCGAIQP